MKKAYINPTTEVVNIVETVQLMAGSIEGFDSTLNESGTEGTNALSFDDLDFWLLDAVIK